MTKKAIGLEAFEILGLDDQMNILHKDAVHVGKRTINGMPAILYQLNDFYVEVLYKTYRKEIEKIVITKDIAHLQPYLSQINVRDLDKDKNK